MSSTLFKATVNEYLKNLPAPVQSRLYGSPATCLAIYRLLPKLAKFFIISMVFNESDVSLRDIDRWVKTSGKFQLSEAIKSMKSLHILTDGISGQHLMVNLNPIFRKSFRNALTGGEVNNSFGNVVEDDHNAVTMGMLDQYAADKWETILHFMVGTPVTKTPSRNVLTLLVHSKLMEESKTGELQITNEGFQFLLQDVNAQMWTLLLQYLKMAESLQMDPVDVLNFIFMLGALELGKAYSDVDLSDTQKSMLQDMRDYGLVFQKASNSFKFYPTRLATMLTSDSTTIRTASGAMNSVLKQGSSIKDEGAPGAAIEEDEAHISDLTQGMPDGALILETNFKLYSYSNSPLQIAILSLFVHLRSRFSNMVTGQITRDSIRRALHNGITADQIIAYLETHAHPQMRRLAEAQLDKKTELDPSTKETLQILPPTVVDQIKLWQLEMDRIISYEGYLFTDFENLQEFQLLSTYATDIGVLLWKDEKKRRFFVSQEGNAQVIDYAKRTLKKK